MRFFIGFLSALVLASLLWIMAIWLQTGRPTESSQWIADVYAAKEKIAAKKQGRRIVIVAGSNALFGVDSKMLEQAFKMPVVNLGVNAGLLLPYNLLKSKEVLRSGDIAIMPLEYHFFVYDGVPNAQMIDQIWSRDPEYFWKLTLKEQFWMVWLTTISRVYDGYRAKGGTPAMCGPYGYKNIDENGDQINTSAKDALAWSYDWENLKKELPRKYGEEDKGAKMGWMWLEEYGKWAKENGVTVVVMPATMMYMEHYRQNEKEREFYSTLATKVRNLGISYVGNPYDYMYERDCYFNTDYHLIDVCRTKRTEMMIRDLIEFLHNPLFAH